LGDVKKISSNSKRASLSKDKGADGVSNRPPYKLVIIEWLDSYTDDKSWHSLKDEIDSPAVCVSVGYLVWDKEKVKVIYPHIALEDDFSAESAKGGMVIPSLSIVCIKELKEG